MILRADLYLTRGLGAEQKVLKKAEEEYKQE